MSYESGLGAKVRETVLTATNHVSNSNDICVVQPSHYFHGDVLVISLRNHREADACP